MPSLKDLVRKMRTSPNNIRFEECERVMLSVGFEVAQPRSGSSHVTFRHPLLRRIVTVKRQAVLKKVYVTLVLDALDELGEILR